MTKYSFHLVNSGALCDPVHKLRFRLNQDFWVSPKETFHTHQILFLLSLSCGSFWWTLSIFALLSRGIKKVNSRTLSAHYNWTTLIPAYSCHRWATFLLLVASLWLVVASKKCWKGKGFHLWWHSTWIIEIWVWKGPNPHPLPHRGRSWGWEVTSACHTGREWWGRDSPRGPQPLLSSLCQNTQAPPSSTSPFVCT